MQTPFGETMGEMSAAGLQLPVRFPGQYYDSETGFNQNWNRDYDPSLGRYIQPDPRGQLLDFSGPDRQVAAMMGIAIPYSRELNYLNHVYGYVDQNPILNTDSTGEAINWGGVAVGGFCIYCGFIDDDYCTTWIKDMVEEERERQKNKNKEKNEPDQNKCNVPGVCRNGQLTNK